MNIYPLQYREVIATLNYVEHKKTATLLHTSAGILKIHKWQWDYLNSRIGLFMREEVRLFWWVDQYDYVHVVKQSRNSNGWQLPKPRQVLASCARMSENSFKRVSKNLS